MRKGWRQWGIWPGKERLHHKHETAVRRRRGEWNGFSARARTEPGLMGVAAARRSPSQSCDPGQGPPFEARRSAKASQGFCHLSTWRLFLCHHLCTWSFYLGWISLFCNVQLSAEHLYLTPWGPLRFHPREPPSALPGHQHCLSLSCSASPWSPILSALPFFSRLQKNYLFKIVRKSFRGKHCFRLGYVTLGQEVSSSCSALEFRPYVSDIMIQAWRVLRL